MQESVQDRRKTKCIQLTLYEKHSRGKRGCFEDLFIRETNLIQVVKEDPCGSEFCSYLKERVLMMGLVDKSQGRVWQAEVTAYFYP